VAWVAGCMPWFARPETVTHTSNNRARRRVTSLIRGTGNTIATTPRRHTKNSLEFRVSTIAQRSSIQSQTALYKNSAVAEMATVLEQWAEKWRRGLLCPFHGESWVTV